MPAAGPIIGALAAGGAAFASGASLLTVGLILAGNLAVGFLQQALAQKPTSLNNDRTQLIRQAITERRFWFGEQVLGGILTEYETTEGSRYHHMIVTLGDAPVAPWDAIPIVWLDDEPIFESQINASGEVISGKFADVDGDRTLIKKHMGGPNQTADPDLIAAVDRLGPNFKGIGIAYLYIRINWDADEFPNGLPSVRAWCRTNTVMDTRDSTRRFTTNLPLILREFLTAPEVGLDYDDADLDDTFTQSAANTADEIVDARPVGHAVVKVDAGNDELDLANAGSGAPLRIETGDRVEIFTTGTAPGGLSTGTSYYAIVERITGETHDEDHERTIALDPSNYSGAAAKAISDGAVDRKHREQSNSIYAAVKLATSFSNAMARTSINITSAGSGRHLVIKTGEPRYHGAGVIDSGMAPKDAIEEILSGMAGRLVWTGATFRILAGAWRTPMAEVFSEADLWGPLTVRTKHSRRERFNSVRGIFATLLATGEQTDYPAVIDSTYVAADKDVRIFRDLPLPWTSRSSTAQRLAKIELARHRRETRMEFPTSAKGLLAVPGSIIPVDNARRSWAEKTFEVLEQEDMEIQPETEGSPALQGVKLMLAELDATAFDFDPDSDETIKPPQPVLRGGNPLDASAPTDLELASGDDELFIKKDGTVISRIKASWIITDAFADWTELQYRRSTASVWSAMGLVDREQTEIHIWEVEDGVSYDVRIRTGSTLGVRSEWVQAAPHQVIGKTAPPPDVDTFNVTRMADGTRRFSWTANPPADVIAGGGFKIRYATGTGGVWSGMTALHTGLLTASPYESNELAAGTYTFGIKMVDSSGNESLNAVVIEATLGDPRLREVLLSRAEEALGWPGTITNGFVTPKGTLEAVSDGSWGGEPTWDGLATTWDTVETTWDALDTTSSGNTLPDTWDALADTWREILPSQSPLVYETPEIDLGADVTFTVLASAEVIGTATIEMQTGTDSHGSVSGPYGAAGTTTARYVRIRISVSGSTPVIKGLTIYLDGETQVEDYEDVNTSAASSGVFERISTGRFKLATRGETGVITSATIRAFQNAGSGWTWELLSKSTTITGDSEPAAEFRMFKNGVASDAIIDAEIKGAKKDVSTLAVVAGWTADSAAFTADSTAFTADGSSP